MEKMTDILHALFRVTCQWLGGLVIIAFWLLVGLKELVVGLFKGILIFLGIMVGVTNDTLGRV